MPDPTPEEQERARPSREAILVAQHWQTDATTEITTAEAVMLAERVDAALAEQRERDAQSAAAVDPHLGEDPWEYRERLVAAIRRGNA